MQPVLEESGTDGPGNADSGTDGPESVGPGSEDPGTDGPGSVSSGTDGPESVVIPLQPFYSGLLLRRISVCQIPVHRIPLR